MTEAKETKSIVDPERRKDMKGARDWVGAFMEAQALTKGVGAREAVQAVEAQPEEVDADGNVIREAVAEVKGKAATKGKDVWDLDLMFLLAERNGIDTSHATFVGIRSANAIGRARMTLHNMLKSRAKKRHGLFDIPGEWNDLDAEQLAELGDPERVEERDGTKIPKAKPAKDDAPAEEAAE